MDPVDQLEQRIKKRLSHEASTTFDNKFAFRNGQEVSHQVEVDETAKMDGAK